MQIVVYLMENIYVHLPPFNETGETKTSQLLIKSLSTV